MIPFIHCNIISHPKLRSVKCQSFHYALIFYGSGLETASREWLSQFCVWGCTWGDSGGGGDTLLRLEPSGAFFKPCKSGFLSQLTRRLHWLSVRPLHVLTPCNSGFSQQSKLLGGLCSVKEAFPSQSSLVESKLSSRAHGSCMFFGTSLWKSHNITSSVICRSRQSQLCPNLKD